MDPNAVWNARLQDGFAWILGVVKDWDGRTHGIPSNNLPAVFANVDGPNTAGDILGVTDSVFVRDVRVVSAAAPPPHAEGSGGLCGSDLSLSSVPGRGLGCSIDA